MENKKLKKGDNENLSAFQGINACHHIGHYTNNNTRQDLSRFNYALLTFYQITFYHIKFFNKKKINY